MFAAYITTEAGEDIRLFSSTRDFRPEIIETKIRKRLSKNEILKFIKPLQVSAEVIDDPNEPDAKTTQIAFSKDFIREVCRAFHLEESIYYGGRRLQVYRDVKYCIYRILRDSTTLSLATIGMIHNRDHSTIINGLKRFNELREFDFDFKATYKSCLAVMEAQILTTQKNVK